MIERYGLGTVVNVHPSIENTAPCRQVPGDDLSVTNNNDVVPSHPQTTNIYACVDDQPWVTGPEVDDCDRIAPQPCSRC